MKTKMYYLVMLLLLFLIGCNQLPSYRQWSDIPSQEVISTSRLPVNYSLICGNITYTLKIDVNPEDRHPNLYINKPIISGCVIK